MASPINKNIFVVWVGRKSHQVRRPSASPERWLQLFKQPHKNCDKNIWGKCEFKDRMKALTDGEPTNFTSMGRKLEQLHQDRQKNLILGLAGIFFIQKLIGVGVQKLPLM